MTEQQFDREFTKQFATITKVARDVSTTHDPRELISEAYLIARTKAYKIKEGKLINYICCIMANIQKWDKKPFTNNIDDIHIITKDEATEENTISIEIMNYAIEHYKLLGNSNKRLAELYVNEGVRTVRAMAERLGITNYASHVMLKEFKLKLKSYVRKAQIEAN